VQAIVSALLSFQRTDSADSQKASISSLLANNKAYVSAAVSDTAGHQLWLNGAKGTDASGGTDGFNGISIGNLRGNPTVVADAFTHYGHICEVIVYSSRKTDAERAGIEAYLSKKWGIL